MSDNRGELSSKRSRTEIRPSQKRKKFGMSLPKRYFRTWE